MEKVNKDLDKELVERGYADLSKLRKPGTPWGWHGVGDFDSIDGIWQRELVENEPEGTVIYINEPLGIKNA